MVARTTSAVVATARFAAGGHASRRAATPNYPEYPSGHNAFSSTVSHGVENLFATRHLQIALISTAVPGVQRFYDSGSALRHDVVDARIWLGFHFRTAD